MRFGVQDEVYLKLFNEVTWEFSARFMARNVKFFLFCFAAFSSLYSSLASEPLQTLLDKVSKLSGDEASSMSPLLKLQTHMIETITEFDEKRLPLAKKDDQPKSAELNAHYFVNLHINVIPIGVDTAALNQWLSSISREQSLANLILDRTDPGMTKLEYR